MLKRKRTRAVSPPSTSLFVAPPPVQSRSRVYSHGYSRPLEHIRGQTYRRRSTQSPGTGTGSSVTDDDDDDDDDEGSAVYETSSQVSSSSFASDASSSAQSGQGALVKLREPSHRRLHIQRIYDLLQLSISRRDGIRAFRCLRILLKSEEWRPTELWRYALEIATILGARPGRVEDEEEEERIDDDGDQERIEDDYSGGRRGTHQAEEARTAQRRLAFLRGLSKTRTGLQLDVFIEMIPELLLLGEDRRALDEIDIVLNQYPYRLEPILHLYGALIFLKLSAPSISSQEGEDQGAHFTLRGVADADRYLAHVPHNLLHLRSQGDPSAMSILKEAERKFENVLNVGRAQSKRGRLDVIRQRSRSRSRSRSVSRSQSGSRSQSRSRSRSRRGGDQRGKAPNRRSKTSTMSDSDAQNESGQEGEGGEGEVEREIDNDEWARNLARAYLEVLRAPLVAQIHLQDSDDDLSNDSNSSD